MLGLWAFCRTSQTNKQHSCGQPLCLPTRQKRAVADFSGFGPETEITGGSDSVRCPLFFVLGHFPCPEQLHIGRRAWTRRRLVPTRATNAVTATCEEKFCTTGSADLQRGQAKAIPLQRGSFAACSRNSAGRATPASFLTTPTSDPQHHRFPHAELCQYRTSPGHFEEF